MNSNTHIKRIKSQNVLSERRQTCLPFDSIYTKFWKMQSDRKLTGRLWTGVGGYGERQKGRITGGRKKFLEVMDVFVILIVNECILWSKLIKWYYIKLLGKGRRGFSTLWNKKRQNKKRCVWRRPNWKFWEWKISIALKKEGKKGKTSLGG